MFIVPLFRIRCYYLDHLMSETAELSKSVRHQVRAKERKSTGFKANVLSYLLRLSGLIELCRALEVVCVAGAATVEKALDVLFHLHAADGSLGLTQIGRDLDLPKSSCHRLLTSLVNREIVERDGSGRYRPGLALLSLGLGAQWQEPVVRAARPVLEAEVLALGETVFLVAQRHATLRVLDKCEGRGFLRVAPEIGDLIPAEFSAAGRLYRIFAEGVDELAPEADSEDLLTAERGYATSRDAWIEGLSVLAVPIWQDHFGGRRDLIATLAMGAASARFGALGEQAVAQRLIAAAAAVGQRLGVPSPRPRPRARRALADSPRRSTSQTLASGRRQEPHS